MITFSVTVMPFKQGAVCLSLRVCLYVCVCLSIAAGCSCLALSLTRSLELPCVLALSRKGVANCVSSFLLFFSVVIEHVNGFFFACSYHHILTHTFCPLLITNRSSNCNRSRMGSAAYFPPVFFFKLSPVPSTDFTLTQ